MNLLLLLLSLVFSPSRSQGGGKCKIKKFKDMYMPGSWPQPPLQGTRHPRTRSAYYCPWARSRPSPSFVSSVGPRMDFTFLNGWSPKKSTILWHMNIIWNSNVSVDKVLLAHNQAHLLHSVHVWFQHTEAELGSCDRHHLVHKVWTIYHLGLYRKSLLTERMHVSEKKIWTIIKGIGCKRGK